MHETHEPPRLHLVDDQHPTQPANAGYTSFCTSDYDCPCEACAAETARRVKRGIRPRRSLPTRSAA